MGVKSDFENLCEQYLLGELSESDRQQLEEAYFAEDELFERYLAVKDDLVDAYSRGELGAEKRRQFEQHFLSNAARQKRVDETRELIRVVSVPAATLKAPLVSRDKSSRVSKWRSFLGGFSLQPMGVRVALAVVVLGVVVGGFFLVKQFVDRNSRQSADQEAHKTSPANTNIVNDKRPAETAPSTGANIGGERATSSPRPAPRNNPSPRSSIAQAPDKTPAQTSSSRDPNKLQIDGADITETSLVLSSVNSREIGDSNSLKLGPNSHRVRLTLVFNGSVHDRFEVSLRTVDGQHVFRRANLKATSKGQGSSVTVTFDSSLLKRQDYIATLNTLTAMRKQETIGEYYFRVEHSSK